MNLLVCLSPSCNCLLKKSLQVSMGVSIAYFSSIALLCIAASRRPQAAMDDVTSVTYFDSVVFLTMFLLIGMSMSSYFHLLLMGLVCEQVDTWKLSARVGL
jgi:hypothetical protein